MVATVLYIDDSDDDAKLARRVIHAYDAETTMIVYPSGEAALSYLKRGNNLLPDVILLDLNLGPIRMNGLEFLLRMRQIDRIKAIPVVILTGTARDVAEAYAIGVEGYLLKPIRLDDWKELLTKLGLT